MRGAKYVQSDLGETFREVKNALKSRQVLFTGTPCQVDGLYRYLGEPEADCRRLDSVADAKGVKRDAKNAMSWAIA